MLYLGNWNVIKIVESCFLATFTIRMAWFRFLHGGFHSSRTFVIQSSCGTSSILNGPKFIEAEHFLNRKFDQLPIAIPYWIT